MKGSPCRPDISAKAEKIPVEHMEATQAAPGITAEQSIRIFRSSPVAIAISRLADGRFVEVNDAFLEISGYVRHEVIGRTSGELGLWAEPQLREEAMDRLRDHGLVRDLEIRCRRKTGETGWLLVSAQRIELDGEWCFLGMFFDITRRKNIEETFRRNENRYRVVVEDQTEVICRFTADGEFTFVNDVYCRFFGKDRRELLGEKWQPTAIPEDLPTIETKLALLSPGNPVVTIENRVFDGSGDVRWMQFVNRAFFDESGALVEIQSVGRDITERREAEVALQRSEAKYRALFENSLDAIFLTVPDGTVREANRAACEMFAMTEEDLVRGGRAGIIDPTDERLAGALAERARTGRFFGELSFIRRDGTRFTAETSSVILDGGSRSFVILHDISERKRAEQELNDRKNTINTMAMELSVAEEKERRRIAEQLHDQIAPKIFLAKMKAHGLGERLPQDQYAPSIDAITALIDLAVEDIRTLTLQLRPPILAELGLEAALKWLAEEFNENYGLKAEVIDDRKPKPLSHELRYAIFQIVRELLLNVAKHAGTKDVNISISVENQWIVVTVEDNGIGFDVADSSLISPRSGGFGIFNTRMKIEYLGGSLKIDSSPGRGTRVLIRVPLDLHSKEKE